MSPLCISYDCMTNNNDTIIWPRFKYIYLIVLFSFLVDISGAIHNINGFGREFQLLSQLQY